jgi:membrane associated rhomboid family serine protease
VNDFLNRLKFPFLLVLAMWVVEIYEFLYNKSFTSWGILPRKMEGLLGILTSPFVHSDFEHLMSNLSLFLPS